MDPFFHTGLSISDSLKTVRKSVLIYETIILDQKSNVVEAFDDLLKKLKEEEKLHKQKEWNNMIKKLPLK